MTKENKSNIEKALKMLNVENIESAETKKYFKTVYESLMVVKALMNCWGEQIKPTTTAIHEDAELVRDHNEDLEEVAKERCEDAKELFKEVWLEAGNLAISLEAMSEKFYWEF